MKSAPLPETITPSRLALSRQEIVGSIKVSELSRFKQLLSSEKGVLNCKVHADKDEQGRVSVSGCIDVNVLMDCQLCLKPLDVIVQQNFKLMIVADDEQAAEILENYEPLLVEHDRVQLKVLIEDEAILALPLVPSHDLKEACQKHENFSVEVATTIKVETKQPFANLKSLMEKSADETD